MTEPFLSIRYLRKTFGSFVAVHDVTIDIPKGEFLTFLGPSGSGKSTTLYAVAGFQQPTSGEVLLEGRSLLSVPSHKRNIGMVFQRYTLFQHLTVAENVAFPLRVPPAGRRGEPKSRRDAVAGPAREFRRPISWRAFRRTAAARGACPGRWPTIRRSF